jgi:hypothetical protein
VIVIDLGCHEYANYPEDISIAPLIERFEPGILWGFDPAGDDFEYTIGNTQVILSGKAAWVYNGSIGFSENRENGLRSYTAEHAGPRAVPCFDIAEFLRGLSPHEQDLVLKMDIEGAEYTLLPHLVATGTDKLLDLLLIEMHDLDINKNQDLLDRLSCPVEQW